MTRNYSRSSLFTYNELSENLKNQIKHDFGFELSDCYSTDYVILNFKGHKEALPLSIFTRVNGNFTHGVFSDSAFTGYFLTLNRDNQEAVIAYKYF